MFTPSNRRELLFFDTLCAGLCIPIAYIPIASEPSIQVCGWHLARPDVMKKGSPKPTSLRDFAKMAIDFVVENCHFSSASPPGGALVYPSHGFIVANKNHPVP